MSVCGVVYATRKTCRCGGSLVSRRHVVTAGHCVARATPRQVHVTLGDYVINSAVEPLPAYTFGVSQIQVGIKAFLRRECGRERCFMDGNFSSNFLQVQIDTDFIIAPFCDRKSAQ
jgi:hypothetical protein